MSRGREIFEKADKASKISRRVFLGSAVLVTAAGVCAYAGLFTRLLETEEAITELDPGVKTDWYYWKLIADLAQPPSTFMSASPGWLDYDMATNQHRVKGDLIDTSRFIAHLRLAQFIPDFSSDNLSRLVDQGEVNNFVQKSSLTGSLGLWSQVDNQASILQSQLAARTDIGSEDWHDSFQELIRLMDARSNLSQSLSRSGVEGSETMNWFNFYQALGFNSYLTHLPETAFSNQTSQDLMVLARQSLNANFSESVSQLVSRPDLLKEHLEVNLNFQSELVQKSFLGMMQPDYIAAMEIARQQLIGQAGEEARQTSLASLLGEDVRDQESGEWVKPGLGDKIKTFLTYSLRIKKAREQKAQTIDYSDISQQISLAKQNMIAATLTSGYRVANSVKLAESTPGTEQILNQLVSQLQVDGQYAFGSDTWEITPELIKQVIIQKAFNLHSRQITENFFWTYPAPICSFDEVVHTHTQLIARYFKAARDGLPPVDSSVLLANVASQNRDLAAAMGDPDLFDKQAKDYFQENYQISWQEFLDYQQAECLARSVLGLALEDTFLNARPGEITGWVGNRSAQGELPTSPSGYLHKRGLPFYYQDSSTGEQRYLPFLSFGEVKEGDFHLACITENDGQMKLVAVKHDNWERFKAENAGRWQRPNKISFKRERFGRTQGLGLDNQGEITGKWGISKTVNIDCPPDADLIWLGNFQVAKPDYEWDVVSGAIFKSHGTYILKTEDNQQITSLDLEFVLKGKKNQLTKYKPFDLPHGGIFSVASLMPLQQKIASLLKTYDPRADLPLAFVHGVQDDLSKHPDRACSYIVEPVNHNRFDPLGWQNQEAKIDLYNVLFDAVHSESPADGKSAVKVVLPLGKTSDTLFMLTDSRTYEPRILTQRIFKLDESGYAVDTGKVETYYSLTDSVTTGQEVFSVNPEAGAHLQGVEKWLFDQFKAITDYTPETLRTIASHLYGGLAIKSSDIALIKRDFEADKQAKRWQSLGLIAAQLGLNYFTSFVFLPWSKLGIPWQFLESFAVMDWVEKINKVEPVQ